MNAGAAVHHTVRRKAVWGLRVRILAAIGLTLFLASCGKAVRQGTSAGYLIVTALEGASGAEPTKFSTTMFSDVITVVKDANQNLVPTVFGDPGRVRLLLALKDVGSGDSQSKPTTNNFITIERYHVTYLRADGRNTPGVDVPYSFDGGITMTVTDAETTGVFEIVRHDAKMEAPLRALQVDPQIITAIAEVTFYGHDQTGRAVSVTGRITIDFGNFGDPTT